MMTITEAQFNELEETLILEYGNVLTEAELKNMMGKAKKFLSKVKSINPKKLIKDNKTAIQAELKKISKDPRLKKVEAKIKKLEKMNKAGTLTIQITQEELQTLVQGKEIQFILDIAIMVFATIKIGIIIPLAFVGMPALGAGLLAFYVVIMFNLYADIGTAKYVRKHTTKHMGKSLAEIAVEIDQQYYQENELLANLVLVSVLSVLITVLIALFSGATALTAGAAVLALASFLIFMTVENIVKVNIGLRKANESEEFKLATVLTDHLLNEMALNEDELSAYQKVFKRMLSKFGVSSPNELPDEQKTKFFNSVDAKWKAEKETD